MKSATIFGAITDIYLSPSKAFNGLKDAKGWSWVAYLLVIGFSTAAIYLFYATADQSYLIEQQIAALPENLSAQEREMAVKQMEQFADSQIWFAVGAPVIAITFFNAIYALYFMLVSKIDPQSDKKYGDWFGFSLWTMMPSIINSIGIMILVISANTDQLNQSLLNYASINQLVLHLDPHSAFFTLTESLGLFMIWGMILTIIGLKSWTNFTQNQAIIYGLLPTILIYGIWFLIAAL